MKKLILLATVCLMALAANAQERTFMFLHAVGKDQPIDRWVKIDADSRYLYTDDRGDDGGYEISDRKVTGNKETFKGKYEDGTIRMCTFEKQADDTYIYSFTEKNVREKYVVTLDEKIRNKYFEDHGIKMYSDDSSESSSSSSTTVVDTENPVEKGVKGISKKVKGLFKKKK